MIGLVRFDMMWITDPSTIVPLIFSAVAFIAVVGLGLPWIQPDIFASRLKVIKRRRDELSRVRRQRLDPRAALRRSSGRVDLMRVILERLNFKNLTEQPELKKKLVQAGWRGQGPLITFTFLRMVLPFAFAGLAALFLFGSLSEQASLFVRASLCFGAALIGYYLPNLLLTNTITRRQQDIQKKFPDALDLMVICVESGLSLEAAFSRVCDEMSGETSAIAEEIGLTTAELAFLNDRRQALENLTERTNTPSMKSLVTSLIQSEKYGTPLAAALRVVAQESRDTRMAKAEEKAASLPAKLTVPMVVFFLPVLFAVMIGPTVIQAMRLFSHG
jgi:tight adherence protein C